MRGLTLRHQIGRRGAALITFAVLDVVYGLRLSTANPSAQPFYNWLDGPIPLWPWAVLWFAVAVLCILGSVQGCDRTAYTAAIGIKVLWCCLYLSGWALGAVPEGCVSAAVWRAFAACVWLIAGWPEPVTSRGQHVWTPPLE